MTWLDLPYRWIPADAMVVTLENEEEKKRFRYLRLSPSFRLLWSIRVDDIGTVWDETSIVYDDAWGLWTLRALDENGFLSSSSFFHEDSIEDVTLSTPFPPPRPPLPPPSSSLSDLAPVTRLLYLDLLHAMGCGITPRDLSPLASWSGYRACRLRFTTTVPTVRSPEALRFLYFLTLLDILGEAKRQPGAQRDGDVVWAAETALELCVAMKKTRFLPWLHIPDRVEDILRRRVAIPRALLEAYTTHRFYVKDNVYETGDPWILDAWSLVPAPQRSPRVITNLLYYLPPLQGCTPSTSIRAWLPDPQIPRVTRTATPQEDPRFSLLNPSILYSPVKKDYLVTIRTSNYHLSTYESRDADTHVVETRTFLCRTNLVDRNVGPKTLEEIPDDLERPLETESKIVGLEDVRLFFTDSTNNLENIENIYIYFIANCCNVPGNDRMPGVVWGRSQSGEPTIVVPLRFGQRVEKNWVPWIVQGRFLLIYSFHPLVVLSIDALMHASDTDLARYREEGGYRPPMVFCTGITKDPTTEMFTGPSSPYRGSGAMIEVSPGKYWGLVHQVRLAHSNKRKYFHRFVELTTSTENNNDGIGVRFSSPFTFHGTRYRVEYALGIAPIASENAYWISYAVMDEDPRLIRVSRDEIQELLEKGGGPMFYPGRFLTETRLTQISRWLSPSPSLLEGWPRRTFWINRACDRTRRLALLRRVYAATDGITSRVPGTEFVRIDAVDGTDPRVRDSWPLARYFRARKKESKHHNDKTVALTLSHFKALETALHTRPADQGDDDWVMIVEDDFTLDHLPLWPCSMADLLHYLDRGEYGTFSRNKDKKIGLCSLARLFRLSEEKYSPASLWEPIRFYGTTLAYLVRYGAIPRMLKAFYETPPETLFVSDYEVFRTAERAVMTTLSWLTPPLENKSTLHKDHEDFQSRCLRDFRETYFPGVVMKEKSLEL